MIHLGDLFDILPTLAENSLDSGVMDPPYGLEFMGKDWDRPWAVTAESAVGFAGRENNLTLPVHRDRRNANCRQCGGRARGGKRCTCPEPDWDRPPQNDMRELQTWCEQWAREVYRVLKPGAYLLAFGGTRTYHRLACGIEDAGFEIRDCLMWLYGSGFPKSLDVSKAIDTAAGVKRETGGQSPNWRESKRDREAFGSMEVRGENAGQVTAPVTEAAIQWQGWGTALKPGWEPIILARKPLSGTVAANVLRHGTGGLNIEGCRVGTTKDVPASPKVVGASTHTVSMPGGSMEDSGFDPNVGRWPANVVLSHHPECVELGTKQVKTDGHFPSQRGLGGLSTTGHGGQTDLFERVVDVETVEDWQCHPHCPMRILDDQTEGGSSGSGEIKISTGRKSGAGTWSDDTTGMHDGGRENTGIRDWGDSGGASRFFYCAKPSREERDYGTEHLRRRKRDESRNVGDPGGDNPRNRGAAVRGNHHPTVKPVALMRWLVRLVTPPNGTVLDCFTGSGTTGMACRYEQMKFVGIEKDAGYHELATARIEAVNPLFGDL